MWPGSWDFFQFTTFLFASGIWSSLGSPPSLRRDEILRHILHKNRYDPQFAPGYHEGIPVHVTVQLVILSIDRVRESAMDYSLTLYLRQMWTDNRLRYDNLAVKEVKDSGRRKHAKKYKIDSTKRTLFNNITIPKKLELDSITMKKVWIPDTYFANERIARFHHVTVPNNLMHIFPNGTVYYSVRLSMTLTCRMTLKKYPFDRQRCPLYISSYGYTEDILTYEWSKTGAFKVRGQVELPTFSISEWHVEDCGDNNYEVGNFTCLRLSVSLSRSYGFYIAQVYVPSVLIVILSWVSFWLDIDAIPARISLGLLTVLTMTTMGVGARSELPRVSYVKAIDVWMAVCLMFVFSALLEFAYVNVTTRVEKRRLSMREAVKMAQTAASDNGKSERPAVHPTVIKRQRARLVDKMARVIFPAIFFTFNAFYWIFFMV